MGKSWFVLGIALALARGGQALGAVPVGEARPVLYLALEDGDRRLQDRCRKLLGNGPIPSAFHYATAVPQADIASVIDDFLDQHQGARPLVILDTLGKVLPPSHPGESAYARDYRIAASLKRRADECPGACFLVVHHNRKATSDDWMDDTSGTQGLNGAADFTLVLRRSRNESDGLLMVTGRDVREAEYALTVNDGSWALKGGTVAHALRAAHDVKSTTGLGDESVKVVEYVNARPEGVKAADVAEALGMSEANVRRTLTRAAEAGRIARAARGLYTPVPSVPSVPNEERGHPDGTLGTHGTPPQDGTDTCPECGNHLHLGQCVRCLSEGGDR